MERITHIKARYPTRNNGFRIAGLKLYPLSLGHLLLFEHYKLAYALSAHSDTDEDQKEKLAQQYSLYDVIMALLICSRPYKTNIHTITPKRLKWLFRCVKYKMILFNNRSNVEEQFISYMKYYLADMPMVHLTVSQMKFGETSQSSAKKPLQSPLLELLIVLMEQYFNYPEEIIMDMTINAIIYKTLIKSELDGNIDMSDHTMTDLVQTIDENKEEIMKQMPAGMKWIGD